MANVKVSAQILNETTGETTGVTGKSRTTTDPNEDAGVYDIGTSERTLAFASDVGVPGYLYLENTDSTNFVEVGWATATYHIKLLAKDIALIPLNTSETSIFLKADTAACVLIYRVIAR